MTSPSGRLSLQLQPAVVPLVPLLTPGSSGLTFVCTAGPNLLMALALQITRAKFRGAAYVIQVSLVTAGLL